MRLRSVALLPAGGAGLEEALDAGADAVAFTLSDASHAAEHARAGVRAAIERAAAAGRGVLALLNHPRTRLLRGDVEAVAVPGLAGVLLAHTVEPQDVRDLAVLLREFELARGIEPGTIAAFPVIGTARGLLRAAEIANAAPRVAGLVFAADAYAADTGARSEAHGPRLAYARGAMVAAARAADGLPLIIAAPHELPFLARSGFAGAVLPGGHGVALANAAFTPAPAVRARAERHARIFEEAKAAGEWVGRDGLEVVDSHEAARARQVLEQGS